MEFLTSGSGLLLAVLGLGFVIIIHELGHFLFAKWAGVRVETFSVGFGPIVYSRTIGETEYALSILPLGGYVAMREQADGSGRTFEDASHGWRTAILSGGVLFNLISSYLILLFLAWYGMPMIPPQVGAVQSTLQTLEGDLVDSPASQLGLRSGDTIISYNGQSVRSFSDLSASGLLGGDEPVQLEIRRDGEVLTLPPAGTEIRPHYDSRIGGSILGIQPPTTNRIDFVRGDNSDIEPGWRVVAVNGEPTADLIGQQLDELLLPWVGREVTLQLQQDEVVREVSLRYAGDSLGSLADAAIGLPVIIESVIDGMPAAEAGLRAGDVMVSVNGEPAASSGHFRSLVRRADLAGETIKLGYRRQDAEGVWQEQVVDLTTAEQVQTGARLIGVTMNNMRAGALPHLPPALGSDVSPLAEAGLQQGDVIIERRPAENDTVAVSYLRGGTLESIAIPEDAYRTVFFSPSPPVLAKFIGATTPPSLAEQLAGTRITEAPTDLAEGHLRVFVPGVTEAEDSTRVVDLSKLPAAVREELLALPSGTWLADVSAGAAGHPHRFTVLLHSELERPLVAAVTPAAAGVVLGFKMEEVPYQLTHWYEAFGIAADASVKMLTRTFEVIPRFFRRADQGGIDASKSLHGPIGIFRELKARLEYLGFASFLKIVALLGLNLCIVNLLPIPITDGGRLVMLGIEVIMRRPVPERAVSLVNSIGLAFIMCLMLFVIGLDVLRIFDRH